jgi:hypothetical protein
MRWRTGRKNPRTIYLQQGAEPSDDDPFIGTLDTVELVRQAVSAVNFRLKERDPKGWPITTITGIEGGPKVLFCQLECGHEFRAHAARTDLKIGDRVGCHECLPKPSAP